MKRKPIVGETLYMLNVGNRARHRPSVLVPVQVKSVGRKYFTVTTQGQYNSEYHFKIEDWREKTEYTADYRLYETEQEWRDEKESAALCEEFRKVFQYGNNSLKLDISELREIRAIIRREEGFNL